MTYRAEITFDPSIDPEFVWVARIYTEDTDGELTDCGMRMGRTRDDAVSKARETVAQLKAVKSPPRPEWIEL